MEDYRKEKHSKSDRLRWNRAKVENFMFLPTFARKLINWLGGIILVRILFVLQLKGRCITFSNHKGSRLENETMQTKQVTTNIQILYMQVFCMEIRRMYGLKIVFP